MLILELFSHTRIYPFEEMQAIDESDEDFIARLFLKSHFEIFNLPVNGYAGAIRFSMQTPAATLSQEQAVAWVEKFNKGFARAVEISNEFRAKPHNDFPPDAREIAARDRFPAR
jgi:hypothetical protein